MAKQKEYICPYCKEKILGKESVQKGRRYYHEECLENKNKEEQEKKQQAQDYKDLIEYICNLYNLEAPTGMMLKQIKDFQNEYGYKIKGIELALRYFHEVLEKPVKDDTGIGIVIYYYEKAKQHYINKMNVEESVQNAKENEERVVYINTEKRKKKNIIDIASI